MSAPRSKLSAIFAGSFAGLLAVVILLMVPILGVRKQVNFVVLDWQELALYTSCLIAGIIAGARVGVREFQSANTMMLLEQSTLLVSDSPAEDATEEDATEAVDSKEVLELNDPIDSEPPSTVPQIEESFGRGTEETAPEVLD